jgi:MASE9
MKRIPQSAKVFVGLVALCAVFNLGVGLMRWESVDLLRFVCFVVLSAAASRMKVSLPGLNGNMSVNLPFMLLAALELSLPQALIVAAVSTAVQCLPKNGKSMTGIQVLFNISTIVNAVALAHLLAHSSYGVASVPKSLLVAAAAAGFFLLDTFSVAVVIGLAEGAPVLKTWKDIVLLSFPYCVLSAGLASMAATAMMFVAWYVPLAMFPVMAVTFASFKRYFVTAAKAETLHQPYVSSAAADD